ncbi:hypothetical protein BOTBODRAFT_137657 [Botryobasidium botryosum FD-172 SS1]|uniref:serine C-palmitoyltransferase n=1 Tax=Botryobasidium botryosum (strain FD-172 SS1) TaxID=930990 RepID=A0A067M1U6_BOTB1|nr:hypothetical protein BOTBODRAFT_137657 [Botryobasidium botryosum FD-172 SS1]
MADAAAATSTTDPLSAVLYQSLDVVQRTFNAIPGSAVLVRYVKSSHQNDPYRTILEVILIIFAIRTLLQSRTRAEKSGKNFIKLEEKEIDDLVDEWIPEPLVAPLDDTSRTELASVPVIAGASGPKPKLVNGKTVVNLASYNFAGLAGNESIKEKAMDTLRKYGLGSCGPPGFYGTLDVHVQLERDIASFLGTESAIIYSQGFSTICSVIPAFCKRGDIIVADRGVNFAIQKGIQISRSTVRWYDHNDPNSLEEVLESVAKEMKKKRLPLTRRFIVTEGIFQNDGAMVDLPKLIKLKLKHKYRLILDESFSFGVVGRTGRGLTELYNVPAAQIDILVGSMANGLCSAGGFCAGANVVVDHQRINGTSFVYSASMPALLAVSASAGIEMLVSTPSLLTTLHENVLAVRSVLDKLDCITIPSHPASAIIHIFIRSSATGSTLSPSYVPTFSGVSSSANAAHKPSNPTSVLSRDPEQFDIAAEERLLQDVVEEALAQGVLITRAKRLRGQEAVEPRPSIRLAITAGLTRKEVEKAAGVVKSALIKVLGKRRY